MRRWQIPTYTSTCEGPLILDYYILRECWKLDQSGSGRSNPCVERTAFFVSIVPVQRGRNWNISTPLRSPRLSVPYALYRTTQNLKAWNYVVVGFANDCRQQCRMHAYLPLWTSRLYVNLLVLSLVGTVLFIIWTLVSLTDGRRFASDALLWISRA